MARLGTRVHYEWHAVQVAPGEKLKVVQCVNPHDVLSIIDAKRVALAGTWTGELWRVGENAMGATEYLDIAPFTFDGALPERWPVTQRSIPDKLHYKLQSAKRRYTTERERIDRATAK